MYALQCMNMKKVSHTASSLAKKYLWHSHVMSIYYCYDYLASYGKFEDMWLVNIWFVHPHCTKLYQCTLWCKHQQTHMYILCYRRKAYLKFLSTARNISSPQCRELVLSFRKRTTKTFTHIHSHNKHQINFKPYTQLSFPHPFHPYQTSFIKSLTI